jgi:hypothetical protein
LEFKVTIQVYNSTLERGCIGTIISYGTSFGSTSLPAVETSPGQQTPAQRAGLHRLQDLGYRYHSGNHKDTYSVQPRRVLVAGGLNS